MDIQNLKRSDVGLLVDLQPPGWRDLIPIFNFYSNSAFCFPVKATFDNKIVGIGAAINHNSVTWLAHIIVHPDHRNKGIGQLITQTLVERAKAKNCLTIYLIATDLGMPVYEKISFETETEYLFFKDLKKGRRWIPSKNITNFSCQMKEQIAHIDQQVSGEQRMFHMEQYLQSGYVYKNNNIIEGFYLPSFGEGLIIANTSSAGLELMKVRLASKVDVVFPSNNLIAAEFMDKNNYNITKKAKRMRLGMKRTVLLANIYNRIGGDIG